MQPGPATRSLKCSSQAVICMIFFTGQPTGSPHWRSVLRLLTVSLEWGNCRSDSDVPPDPTVASAASGGEIVEAYQHKIQWKCTSKIASRAMITLSKQQPERITDQELQYFFVLPR